MGVKKSTVWTRAISSVTLYTPASSAVEVSTKRFGSCCGGSSDRACPNTVGLILEAQPAQATRLVSFHCFCLRNISVSLLSTSSTIDWLHTVAYRTRFCPCFARSKKRPGTCTDRENVQLSALGSAPRSPRLCRRRAASLRAARSLRHWNLCILPADRRTHDIVPVVNPCGGTHWRVWHTHWRRRGLCAHPYAAA